MSRLIARVVVVVAVLGSTVSADVSRGVIAAFRGQLVVTKDDLPEGKSDAETIKKIKAAQLKEVVGEPTNTDVVAWHFHYAAFLSKTGSKSLKLEFMNGANVAADKRITDVDPKSAMLLGDITIDEDEGLAKGKTYTVNLVDAGDHVVASTKLTMK
jgi:hypothetical protein